MKLLFYLEKMEEWVMAFHKPEQIAELVIEAGVQKVIQTLPAMLILGFLGGAFIAIGFLLNIRVLGNLPERWGSLVNVLGGAVFPVGLMLVVLAGGELITGNMMSLSMALYAKKITLISVLNNWVWITLMNFIGAIFVAYCFGHLGGLTEGEYLNKTVAIAEGKLHESFGRTLILAIGCNWLVCLALWLAYGTSDFVGKIIGIWIPIMAFVVIGFQQVVANMFVISAVIFAGHLTWMDLAKNFVPVFIGNVIGGAGFVGFAYFACYQKQHSNMK